MKLSKDLWSLQTEGERVDETRYPHTGGRDASVLMWEKSFPIERTNKSKRKEKKQEGEMGRE